MTYVDSIQWVSEDVAEICLGEPLAEDTFQQIRGISQWIDATRPDWLVDYCYGFGVLSVTVDPRLASTAILVDMLKIASSSQQFTSTDISNEIVEIPVCYDLEFGLDLEFLSTVNRLSVDEIISLHRDRDYRVLATGFVPGFAYLGETDQRIQLPRRDTPRTRIPAGSVAIAENQTVIYPNESPGGWHIVGRMPGSIVRLSDTAIEAKLAMGVLVRFKEISRTDFDHIEATHATHSSS